MDTYLPYIYPLLIIAIPIVLAAIVSYLHTHTHTVVGATKIARRDYEARAAWKYLAGMTHSYSSLELEQFETKLIDEHDKK